MGDSQVKAVTGLQDLRRRAAPVLNEEDPLKLVRQALQAGGYGGNLRPAVLAYLAATTRLLALRPGAMPAHLLLIGQPSAGKSYALNAVLRLLPSGAYIRIDAGSPRALIYDKSNLKHRVLVFGEADSLPTGEDNPAASAIRNLLQDHRLHYKVAVWNATTCQYVTQQISKDGPTVLLTTSIRRLGEQLSSRMFCFDVPDDQDQVRKALLAQAKIETEGVSDPPDELIAFQALLQAKAPWDIIVPFAEKLAKAAGQSPVAFRVLRDQSRLLALIKAAAIIRHQHRRKNPQGQLEATLEDYETVYTLVQEVYAASVSGASMGIRVVVQTVGVLQEGSSPVTVGRVAKELGISKMAASRRIRDALHGGWLLNDEMRPGRPFNLRLGEPLPDSDGLPRPEALQCNTLTPLTRGEGSNLGTAGRECSGPRDVGHRAARRFWTAINRQFKNQQEKEVSSVPDIARVAVEVAGGVGAIIAEPIQFKTGSSGFYGQGKVKATDGKRYQVTINIVEIGSKNKNAV